MKEEVQEKEAEEKEEVEEKAAEKEEKEEVEAPEEQHSADKIVKSLRSTVLPILRKMWQEKKKGEEGKSMGSKTPAVRIAVISVPGSAARDVGPVGGAEVMMHCLRHLPAKEFCTELPRILGYAAWLMP